MISSSTVITLIHHPTVALKILGFTDPAFMPLAAGAYLGNIYRRIIPPSLPRVASVIERDLTPNVNILDLRIADFNREETYKTIDWEGYQIEARRVGAPFSYANDSIEASDWIGLSSHFTFESGIVRDLIRHIKQVKPSAKVMVGGADVMARPSAYLGFGADLVFGGDFNPADLAAYRNIPTIAAPYRESFDKLLAPAFDKLSRLQHYDDSHDGPVPKGVPFPIGFIHFTRGCPRECDFCESRRTSFEFMGIERAVTTLEHYRNSGIRTLNFADDNILLLAAKEDTRDQLLQIFRTLRDMKFAWEYPNGLEIGRLMTKGVLDDEVVEAMFSHHVDPVSGNIVGAYRAYIPIETFDRRVDYKKLKPVEEQNRIIQALAETGLIELDFGVVIPPDATELTFEHIEEGYREVREIVGRTGDSLARYAVFHLIPIALFREMKTKYTMDAFPEGWNFYFPVYDGAHFSARELFERRLRLVQKIDYGNFASMAQGQYSYSRARAQAQGGANGNA